VIISGRELIVVVLVLSSMPVIPFFGRSKNDILKEASSYFEEVAGQMSILRSENLWTPEQRTKLEDRLAEYVLSLTTLTTSYPGLALLLAVSWPLSTLFMRSKRPGHRATT
jgi:hypothetical protein